MEIAFFLIIRTLCLSVFDFKKGGYSSFVTPNVPQSLEPQFIQKGVLLMLGILILVVFFAIVGLIIARRIPVMLALPLAALLIPIIAGAPIIEVLNTIISEGSYRMASTLMAVIFGVMLGQVMNKTGITATIIRKAAELGGDKPILISITLFFCIAIIFTGAGQLGTYIMMANIALPVMMTVGIPGVIAHSTLVIGAHVGSTWSLSNWAYFEGLVGVGLNQCIPQVIIITVAICVVGVTFIIIQAKKVDKATWAAVSTNAKVIPNANAPWYSLITPILPILLVAFLKINAIAALIIGCLYACLTTNWRRTMDTLVESMYDCLVDGRSSFVMVFGIGMLVAAVRHEAVAVAISPVITAVLPSTLLGYVAFFTILAPLQLYRGPMSIWGMGAGIGALMAAAGILTPVQIAVALMILDRFMAADPTLTYNIWGANFLNCDVNDIMKKLIPYMWVVVLLSMIGAGITLF
jgi:H+/gluconate symporter-like permease